MRNVIMFIALLLISAQAFAGGKIAGKVTDEKNGETIIGATVTIKGTSIGGVTDIDGKFNIPADAGTYTLVVKYIGYQTKEVGDVAVANDEVAVANITIGENKNTELTEVVVRSSVKKENINTLYAIQKNAVAISDGISADVIRKSPDRTTGEVLKRISGTTIQDNKFVIIRGLSDRYNTAMMDNAILPSTEANRKAFSFDIVPASMIDNVVITKAGTPDLPADFAGGVINILTKEIPDNKFATISIGTAYNSASTFQNFKSGYRTGTDFLGFDDGSRQQPKSSSFPATNADVEKLNQQYVSGNKTATIAALNQFNNNYDIKQHKASPAANLQFTAGNSWRGKNGSKFGVVGGITYNHTETIQKDLLRQYKAYNYTDNIYKYSSNLGGMLNFGYSKGNSKITLKTLFNRNFDDNFLERSGQDFSTSKDVRFYAYDLFQKSLFKTTLQGDHRVGKAQNKINWVLSFNHITNNQPDQRKVSYYKDAAGDYEADLSSTSKIANRSFTNLSENITSLSVNYIKQFNMFGKKQSFKVGADGQYRSRSFEARFLGIIVDENNPAAASVKTQPVNQIFSQQNIESGIFSLGEVYSPSDKYDATTTTLSAYAMLDNKLTDKLRFVWGLRVEDFNLKLTSPNNIYLPAPGIDSTWIDLLPSGNLTYALNEKTNLRAAYYRTVARPELREIAPFSYYDYELSALANGWPALTRTQIDNIDLRYELYPAAGEVISGSVFYKHFKNPLETKVEDGNSALETTVRNYPKADNYGVEAEVRKNLGFISSDQLFKNTVFYANLAYIKSVVKLEDNINKGGVSERPLSGQSNYVVNASLTYAAMKGKLNFNVLYNRIGPRIYLVAGTAYGNVYEQPRNLLDFQVSYALSKRSDLRLNIKDILNSESLFYFDQNGNGKFDGVDVGTDHLNTATDMILSKYRPGSTYSLTYSFKF